MRAGDLAEGSRRTLTVTETRAAQPCQLSVTRRHAGMTEGPFHLVTQAASAVCQACDVIADVYDARWARRKEEKCVERGDAKPHGRWNVQGRAAVVDRSSA